MPSLIDFRRRIRSVKNTQQITKAMKMVSAARLRRAQERVVAGRPYAAMFNDILTKVAAAAASDEAASDHPLLARRDGNRMQLVVVTSDRGLAGAFNANITKATSKHARDNSTQSIGIEAVGRKGRDFFRSRAFTLSGEHLGVTAKPNFDQVKEIARVVIDRYANREIDSLYVVYNEFKSVMTQKLTIRRVLPVEIDATAEVADYIWEQEPQKLLESMLPRYVELTLWQAIVESAAAELAARMTAMDAASKNANEVIEKVTLQMNRVRQAAITKEIIEVVSGASALE